MNLYALNSRAYARSYANTGFLVPFGLTFRGCSHSVLYRGLDRMFVVIGILYLLTTIAQVSQDAHTILNNLVADVGLFDRRTHHVEQRVHETLALTQVLSRVLACARNIPQHAGRVSKDRGPTRLAVRRARVPAAVRYYYVVHHHRYAVIDDRPLQILKLQNLHSRPRFEIEIEFMFEQRTYFARGQVP